MKEIVNITNSEWNVMQCLWGESPLTLMQIVNILKEEKGWAKSTTTTMIARLQAKGLIEYEEGGKAKLFYPGVQRTDVEILETETFLNKIYNGSVGMMVNALVERNQLSREEINELYDILQKAEEANK